MSVHGKDQKYQKYYIKEYQLGGYMLAREAYLILLPWILILVINQTMGICIKRSQASQGLPISNVSHSSNQPERFLNSNEANSAFPVCPIRPGTNIISQVQLQPQQGNKHQQNKNQLKMSLKLQGLKRLSLTERRQSNNDNLCDICYEKYDILTKWPMQVCSNQHYICDQCVKDFQHIYHNQPFPCPLCRQLIFMYKIKPYQKLFRSLNNLEKVKQQMGCEELQLYYFAFEHQLYDIARAYKDKQQEKIKKLEHLAFDNKLIAAFPYFSRFPKAKFLQLQRNSITKCQFLQPICNTLQILNLSRNQIQELQGLSKFEQLQLLACEYNNIKTITLSKNILCLKELYLIGNKICNVGDFQEEVFAKLQILSIESEGNAIELAYKAKINRQSSIANAPSLHTIIMPVQLKEDPINKKESAFKSIKMMYRQSDEERMSFESQSYVSIHILHYYNYGSLFPFQPDINNPQYHQYSFQANTLTKVTQKFTNINSNFPIPPLGKQTLRLRISEKNSNIMIGVCTANIKHDCSVYSNEFIGLTLWGTIYNRAEQVPIQSELRLKNGSIITMTIDFDNYIVFWHIDERKIGEVQVEQYYLLENRLYFDLGVRDQGVKMQFFS